MNANYPLVNVGFRLGERPCLKTVYAIIRLALHGFREGRLHAAPSHDYIGQWAGWEQLM
jgi:hypothetical protein